ncbi:hypothetical protein PQR33_46305 [Paraburkholderia sediminicola]|uniref:hypothetical protein n=1 Tax=Paraburkholderia sediminicola TaxID=458836 RepID=UPI0038B8822F
MQRLAALLADTLERIECGFLFVVQIVFNVRARQVLRQGRTPPCGCGPRPEPRRARAERVTPWWHRTVRLTRQPLGTDAESGAVRQGNLVLQRLQLLPQHACQPVLFEREGLQRIGLDRQFRDSDGGGQHGYHDAQLALRLQEPVAVTLRRREQHHLTRVTATARCDSRAGISMPSSHAP